MDWNYYDKPFHDQDKELVLDRLTVVARIRMMTTRMSDASTKVRQCLTHEYNEAL